MPVGQTGLVLLLRIEMSDLPGSLGQVATAMGKVGADISAIDIVEKGEGRVIDDFMVTLPPGAMPDTLVSACNQVEGVRVLWLSRHTDVWFVENDVQAIERMIAEPGQAAEVLTQDSPSVFHVEWAVLLSLDPPTVIEATPLAPVIAPDVLARLAPHDRPHTAELDDSQLPGWGDTSVALAPVSGGRVLLLGRRGGPAFLGSELRRLEHLAALA